MRLGEISLGRTGVSIALFGDEVVALQGSRVSVANRDWPLPAIALNLEIMAQDGDMSSGSTRAIPCSASLPLDGDGLRRPTDNLPRVVMPRLREGVEVIALVRERYDYRPRHQSVRERGSINVPLSRVATPISPPRA